MLRQEILAGRAVRSPHASVRLRQEVCKRLRRDSLHSPNDWTARQAEARGRRLVGAQGIEPWTSPVWRERSPAELCARPPIGGPEGCDLRSEGQGCQARIGLNWV